MGSPADIDRLEIFASEYKAWLKRMVDPAGEYDCLLDLLFDLEFTWTVEFDENRAMDGIYLRNQFKVESGLECPFNWVEWPCSILELLLALSIKIEDTVMYSLDEGDRTAEWFWIMVDNLGISQFDDSHWSAESVSIVCDAICIFLNRSYEYDGTKGLFPLSNPKEDQRNLEIWWQMHEYFQDFNR